MPEKTTKPLSYMLALVSDRSGSKKDSSKPYVGLEHIPSAGSSLIAVGAANDSVSTNTLFVAGDILFGKLRPRLRKSVAAKFSGYCSTDILVLRPTGNVDPVFAGFVAQSDAVFLSAIRTEEGTKMPRCSWRDLKAVDVFCPVEKTTQTKVAAILTSIDTAIEKTEALIAKYQQVKAGLMHDLFTRGVLPNGQLRPTREQAPELYQESAIGWIPNDWTVIGLASKGRPGASWIRTGPFGSSLKGEHWRIDGRPVITIGALGTGEFIDSELLFVGPKDAARLIDFQLSPGDVVFSRVADVGRSVVVRKAQAGWIMSSNLMRLAVDEAELRPDYLQMQLAGDSRVKAQIRASVNSGGRDVANSEVLNRLRFALPKPDEQDRIISRANQLTQRLGAEMNIVSKLQTKKLGLMQNLLTGKVAVKVDAEAPEPTHG